MLRGLTPMVVEIQLLQLYRLSFDMDENMYDLVYIQHELDNAFLRNFTAWF